MTESLFQSATPASSVVDQDPGRTGSPGPGRAAARRALWRGLFGILLATALPLPAQPYGLETRPDIGPFLNQTLPESGPTVSADWTTRVAFPHQTFYFPMGLTQLPGTTNLVVWEREGIVWSFPNDPDATNRTQVLNITNQCQGWFECGLLGLAFHPGFETNRYMFVYYNWVPPGTVEGGPADPPFFLGTPTRNRLSRFTLDANGVALPGSETVFIDQARTSLILNGGGLAFHPDDGFLYLSLGDEPGAELVMNQQIDIGLFAGVVRIDVDRRGGDVSHPIPRQPVDGVTDHYYIPNDNPFVGQEGVLEEFFALGLRNPHRLSIDPPTGRVFIGDVGDVTAEEVNVIEPGEAGLNFQWNLAEGDGTELEPPFIGISRQPWLDYTHAEGVGKCVIGGFVYRGQRLAEHLGGRYIFGDNISRNIWMVDESTSPPAKVRLATMPRGPGPISGNDYTGISSFGTDQEGELYICQLSTIGSQIYRLEREFVVGQDLPPLLSQTGVFTNLDTLEAAPAFIPYDVASPLWSDGAVKRRWAAIPTNDQIRFSSTNQWLFPAGSVFVKHFDLPISDTDPTLLRRLETRLLVTDTNGYVYGVTYRWREDQSDADLLVTGLEEEIAVATATGVRTQIWSYPSRQDCLSCHTGPAGGVLGLKTRQLNRPLLYPQSGVTDNQLRTWNHVGLFTPPLDEPDIPSYLSLVTVTNQQANLTFRVRSYLDSNCAQCHRPGVVQASWDGRIHTPLEEQGIIDAPPGNSLGIPDARIVAPGNLSRSILYQRMESLGPIKMPPLGHNVVDQDALEALATWIQSLAPIHLQVDRLPAETLRIWFSTPSEQAFVVEDSMTLQNWSPIATNTAVDGEVEFLEPPPRQGHRFFRVRLAK